MTKNIIYIKCNNEKEWDSIQKYYFKRNIFWRYDDKAEYFYKNHYPMFIVIEYNTIIHKNCLTYHEWKFEELDKNEYVEAKIFLRQEKLKRIQ